MSVSNIGFLVDPETRERIAYNRDTGQILRETLPPVVFLRRPKTFNELYGRGAWWVMSDALPDLMAFDKELSRQEPTRVFWYLVKRLDFENYIRVPQTEVAEALKMQKSHVSRAVKLLESKGVLLRGPKVGQSYSWRLNPNCGFKGDPRGKVVKFPNGQVGFRSPHPDWIKETFTLPREEARQAVRTYRQQYPKPIYQTEIENWQELPDGRIEVTMRRLPNADPGAGGKKDA